MGGLCGLVSWNGPLAPDAIQPLIDNAGQRTRDGHHHLQPTPQLSFAHLKIHDVTWTTTTGVIHTPDTTIVTDSRLDDTKNLTAQLGIDYRTPDPTILLHAYRTWGHNLAQHLTGDYAFAIYDHHTHTLTAARDPFSMRSLHWTRTPQGIAFASDANQLLALPTTQRKPNIAALAAHIAAIPPEPNETFWHNIQTIPPAHTLTATQHNTHTTQHWAIDPTHTIRYRNPADYIHHCRHLLDQAINDRLTNTAHPVGLSLSGGVDSTTAAVIAGTNGHTLNTYSFQFQQLTSCDETHISTPTAKHYGHTITPIPADHLGPLASALPEHGDGPAISPFSELNLAVVRRSVTAGDRVLITCDRGDSLFGGSSPSLLRLARSHPIEAARATIREGLYGQILAETRRVIRRRPHESVAATGPPVDSWLDAIATSVSLRREQGFLSPRHAWIADPLAHRIAEWSDRAWASHGSRFVDPFADRRLAEFAHATPSWTLNSPGLVDKRVLDGARRTASASALPQPAKVSLAPLFHKAMKGRGGVAATDIITAGDLQEFWPTFSSAVCLEHVRCYIHGNIAPGRILDLARSGQWVRKMA